MNHLEAAVELRRLVDISEGKFLAISEEDAGRSAAPDTWSRKQIFGHLIDSAANNHQRFIRMQTEAELHFPGYAAERLGAAELLCGASLAELIALWAAYNRHLAAVMEQIASGDAGEISGTWEEGRYIWNLSRRIMSRTCGIIIEQIERAEGSRFQPASYFAIFISSIKPLSGAGFDSSR